MVTPRKILMQFIKTFPIDGYNSPCIFSIYYEGILCSNNLYSEEVFECQCTRGKKQPKSLECVSTLWTGCVKNEKSVTTKQDRDVP